MAYVTKRSSPASEPAGDDPQALRSAGLHPVEIWVPDTRAPEFAELCRRQSRAVAESDPAGDEMMDFVAAVYEWPER